MNHPIVVGLQFGDEGKGKITDYLARQANWVIRFNGGNNAGHTLWLNGKKLVTHSVPSGVLYPHIKNYIGAGCVIDPAALAKELSEIKAGGADLGPDRLKIDSRAHLTLPVHLALDAAKESGEGSIGTTKRGIGPTYATKMDRLGIRVADLFSADLEARVTALCKHYEPLLISMGMEVPSVQANMQVVLTAKSLLTDYVNWEANPFYDLAKREKFVLEGAQGILLDLDHGSFPFVTSSNTLPAYAAVGTPFPMSRLGKVLGVAKAYLTRVGKGPFPSELDNAVGQRLRDKGGEYGATTGRPRRVGWLNLDELKAAVRLSDCSGIVLTKSDVLSGEESVCVFKDGRFIKVPGWDKTMDTSGNALHPMLEKFIQGIEENVGIPVVAVGTGPDREELVWRHPNQDFWS